MKTKFIILMLVFLFPNILRAQSAQEKPSVIFIIKSEASTKEVVTRNLIMPFSNAKSFDIMSSEEAKTRFPNAGKLVVYVVTLSPNVKLVSLAEFYKHRKIASSAQKSIIVDGLSITNASDALVDESSVKSIEVEDGTVKLETVSKDKAHGYKSPHIN